VQFALRDVMFVEVHALGPDGSPLLLQPVLTVPDGQSVQVDTLTAHDEPVRPVA